MIYETEFFSLLLIDLALIRKSWPRIMVSVTSCCDLGIVLFIDSIYPLERKWASQRIITYIDM